MSSLSCISPPSDWFPCIPNHFIMPCTPGKTPQEPKCRIRARAGLVTCPFQHCVPAHCSGDSVCHALTARADWILLIIPQFYSQTGRQIQPVLLAVTTITSLDQCLPSHCFFIMSYKSPSFHFQDKFLVLSGFSLTSVHLHCSKKQNVSH